MNTLTTVIQIWLASLFLYTGLAKALHYREWRMSLGTYGIPVGRIRDLAAIAPIAAEVGVAAALFAPSSGRIVGGLVALLGIGFFLAERRAVARGAGGTCSCSGTTQAVPSRVLLTRALLITGAGTVLLFANASSAAFLGFVSISAWLVGLTLAALSGIAAGRQTMERRRAARVRSLERARLLALLTEPA